MKTDSQILKLHVAHKQVWYLDGMDIARTDGHAIEDFLDTSRLQCAERVRLLGLHANARLITALYDRKLKGQPLEIEVASPLACASVAERHNPEAVLYRMRLFERAPSVGGFHTVTENDYRAYALAVETMQSVFNNMPTTQQALRLLRAHPAWRAVSFIHSVNPMAVAGLLSYMLDPRWFVDPCYPDRLSKLYMSLGLHPKTQAGVTLGGAQHRNHKRCALVLRCWKDRTREGEVRSKFEVTAPVAVTGSSELGLAPYDFSWRQWGLHMGIGMDTDIEPNPVKADLRASQRFVAFLRHTWLDALYRDSSALPGVNTELFRPGDFFKQHKEIIAYQQHVEATEGDSYC